MPELPKTLPDIPTEIQSSRQRIPPQNIEAESSVLGALLLDKALSGYGKDIQSQLNTEALQELRNQELAEKIRHNQAGEDYQTKMAIGSDINARAKNKIPPIISFFQEKYIATKSIIAGKECIRKPRKFSASKANISKNNNTPTLKTLGKKYSILLNVIFFIFFFYDY